EEILSIIEKIIEAIAKPCKIESREIVVQLSIGVAIYPSEVDSAEELLRNADKALYLAKARKGNSFEFYNSRLDPNLF
ncbi:MAG: diguanylate cyclase, partial [Gammaproteobacteria bacterium]|nr:diguanylate cyclase [Gammaproteobacteria bacterium]